MAKIDKVDGNSGVHRGPGADQLVKHDRTMQRPRPDLKPRQGLSRDELDYNDTDLQQGDEVQRYEHGHARQTVGNAV